MTEKPRSIKGDLTVDEIKLIYELIAPEEERIEKEVNRLSTKYGESNPNFKILRDRLQLCRSIRSKISGGGYAR